MGKIILGSSWAGSSLEPGSPAWAGSPNHPKPIGLNGFCKKVRCYENIVIIYFSIFFSWGCSTPLPSFYFEPLLNGQRVCDCHCLEDALRFVKVVSLKWAWDKSWVSSKTRMIMGTYLSFRKVDSYSSGSDRSYKCLIWGPCAANMYVHTFICKQVLYTLYCN